MIIDEMNVYLFCGEELPSPGQPLLQTREADLGRFTADNIAGRIIFNSNASSDEGRTPRPSLQDRDGGLGCDRERQRETRGRGDFLSAVTE